MYCSDAPSGLICGFLYLFIWSLRHLLLLGSLLCTECFVPFFVVLRMSSLNQSKTMEVQRSLWKSKKWSGQICLCSISMKTSLPRETNESRGLHVKLYLLLTYSLVGANAVLKCFLHVIKMYFSLSGVVLAFQNSGWDVCDHGGFMSQEIKLCFVLEFAIQNPDNHRTLPVLTSVYFPIHIV